MKKITVLLVLSLLISINCFAQLEERVPCEELPENYAEEALVKADCHNIEINRLLRKIDRLPFPESSYSESDTYSLSESPSPYEPVNYKNAEPIVSKTPEPIGEEIGNNEPEATSSPFEGPWGGGSVGGGQD